MNRRYKTTRKKQTEFMSLIYHMQFIVINNKTSFKYLINSILKNTALLLSIVILLLFHCFPTVILLFFPCYFVVISRPFFVFFVTIFLFLFQSHFMSKQFRKFAQIIIGYVYTTDLYRMPCTSCILY
jgi:hypothetical protein